MAVISPGPDMALVVRIALLEGRQAATQAAAGIALGICCHVLFALSGLALLLSWFPDLLWWLQALGGAYLMWLGWQGLRAPPSGLLPSPQGPRQSEATFRAGLLTNLLNAKATLFFASLFSLLTLRQTPESALWLYGAWMVFATFAWFALLSLVVGHHSVREQLQGISTHIGRLTAVVLFGLGVWLAGGALAQALN